MNRPEPLIAAQGLTKSFGDIHLFRDLRFTLNADERVALIGPNGSGKSTLLAVLAGAQQPDEGEVVCRRGLSLGLLQQEPAFPPGATVRSELERGMAGVFAAHARLDALGKELETAGDEELARLLAEQEELHAKLDRCDGWEPERELARAAEDFVLPPQEQPCAQLSGGEARRLALARYFLESPELLILDEPTNHLDPETIERLEDKLRAYPGSLLFVTHDRYFLDRVATRLLELDPGRTHSGAGQLYVHDGNYSSFLAARAERDAMEQRTADNRRNLMRQELAWMRRGIKARRTRQKARVERFETLSDALADEREAGELRLLIPPGPRLGKRVLEVRGLAKGFAGQSLFAGLDFRLEPGARVGILGQNGTGKTTFLKLLLGELEPDAGEVDIGPNSVLAYIEQSRATLDPTKTVLEEVSGPGTTVRVGNRDLHVITYLKSFLFGEERMKTRVAKLSGGERNRVLLAKLLRDGGNVLLLDEPTNDLDLASLRALEDALLHFPGCVLIVSHDRFFLNRVATSILAFEGDGRVHHFDGDYEVYAAWRKERQEARAAAERKAEKKRAPVASHDHKAARKAANALASVERDIATGEEAIARLQKKLEDPELYAPGQEDTAAAVQAELAETQAALERLYARWEELAEAAEG